VKFLFLVDDFLPHSTKVAAKMMHELALEFNAKGHEVTVLTPYTNLETKIKETTVEGVKVLFFKSGEFKNTSKVKRAINESLFSFVAWQAAKKYFRNHPNDAIVYYSPSIFWGHLIGKLKKLWNVKSYLILRDIFPQWAVDNGLIKKKSPIHSFFKYFESINYRNANFIGVMSPSNILLFEKRKEYFDKCEVLFNWSKIEEGSVSKGVFRRKLKLEEKVVLFYGGNIGQAQNMMNLVRLAKRLKSNKKAHFLFVGQGDEVDLILKEKEKYQLDNLTYLPPVDQKTYFQMLNDFDIGMFSLHPGHSTNNFPGKLLGYMKLSKPILGSVNANNDLKQIVNEGRGGFVFNSGEDDKLYKAAVKLIESRSLRLKLGNNGKKMLAKYFSVEQACRQIENKFYDSSKENTRFNQNLANRKLL